MHRESVKTAARLVVKLGTGVLTDSRKQPDPVQLEQLVAQVAALRKAGKEIVLVTSGAVGAGMGALGYEKRPGDLAGLAVDIALHSDGFFDSLVDQKKPGLDVLKQFGL